MITLIKVLVATCSSIYIVGTVSFQSPTPRRKRPHDKPIKRLIYKIKVGRELAEDFGYNLHFNTKV